MTRLQTLQAEIVGCARCPRLVAYRGRVAQGKVRRYRDQDYWGRPVPSLGDPRARLVIVGLAPAAHGGNRTGRIFTGDRSGDWLFRTLHAAGFANQPTSVGRGDGLRLLDCYITAAIHCAPPGNRPLPPELERCRPYLVQELQLLRDLRVVVALGGIAFENFLKAWKTLGRPLASPRPRFGHGRVDSLAGGITLISSYHPSQQNTQTGRLTRPMFHAIFRRARALVEGAGGGASPRPARGKRRPDDG